MMVKQVIYGTIPSKSNSYRIITVNGHHSLAKTPAVKKFESDFFLQCGAYRNKNISERVENGNKYEKNQDVSRKIP